jgi:hypothetical protein
MPSKNLPGVRFVERSDNAKLGKGCAATYVSIQRSCSDHCPLKAGGCYAKTGNVGMHSARMDREAANLTSMQLAQNEAASIDASPTRSKILRLHVSGDCSTPETASIVAAAANRWKNRCGGKVWTYTHSWREVNRSVWKGVSILASVHTVREAVAALKRRYAPAIIVGEFASPQAFQMPGSRITWIPCPAQSMPEKGITCDKCQLCLNAERLAKNYQGIAFKAHGSGKNLAKRHLKLI